MAQKSTRRRLSPLGRALFGDWDRLVELARENNAILEETVQIERRCVAILEEINRTLRECRESLDSSIGKEREI